MKKWLNLGLKKGLTDLQIFSTKNESLRIDVYNQKVDKHVQSSVEVMTIRGIYDGKMSSVRFENLSDANIESMLDRLIENAKALTTSEPAIIYEGSPSYPEVVEEETDFEKVDVKDRIQLLMDLEKAVLASEKIKQVQATQYQETATETTIVNTKGLSLSRSNRFAYSYALGVFGDDNDIVTAYDIKLAKQFKEFDAKEIAAKTIDKGVSKLGGKTIKTNRYPVVFSNEMFASILGVFVPVFTGEAAHKNLTALKDKVGEKIALDNINIIDDPLLPEAFFKSPFDDEGVACQKRYIVENGVFKGFFHNLKTAKIFNVEPTGHGFNGAIAPTNCYLEPGKISFDELIKPIEDGVYITDLVGLHAGVKTVSGDFSLQASGFKIKDGKLDHPVKMIVVSGNFFTLLNNIKGIANDFRIDLSNMGSASVYIDEMMIAGEEQ
ncbi:MAG: metallopeptidase TldD-related protein [Acholeplasmataceae bacterium]